MFFVCTNLLTGIRLKTNKFLNQSRIIKMNFALYKAGVELLKHLQNSYSNCFFPRGDEKPLKKGIIGDLIEQAGFEYEAKSNRIITAAIQIYTCSLSYRAALIENNAQRIDLHGNQVEAVSKEEQLLAKGQRKLRFTWDMSLTEISEFKKLKLALDKKANQKLKIRRTIINNNGKQ